MVRDLFVEMTPMADDRLARTFVDLADTLVDEFDVIEFLHMLVDRCMELLEVSATGLLLADSQDQLRVMASSAENIHLLELFQLQNDEGPCLDCYRTGAAINHPDLSEAADRWPLFAPAATESGFRTVHALPMRLRSQVIGALNLFHTEPNALAPEVTRIGQALADVATIGLIQERAMHQQDILVGQLQTALDSRVIVEQAKGVIAERCGIDPGEAFTLLRTYARNHNQRLAELAASVLDGTAGELVNAMPSPPRQGIEPDSPSRYAGRRRKTTRG
ncbi:MAG: GAF and ANTAR domain-containing protein [Actinobacteria bacterium]|nr:GAF and ANTAR domain-containing protein [Actinomycetota bacterium]